MTIITVPEFCVLMRIKHVALLVGIVALVMFLDGLLILIAYSYS